MALILMPLSLAANASLPPVGHTGGFAEPTCIACHTGTVNPPTGSVSINAPGAYTPGGVYNLLITIGDSQANTWGFELSARFDNGAQAGTFQATGPNTAVRNGTWDSFPVQYAEQSQAPVQSGTSYQFLIAWTAPPDVTSGEVVFDVVGLAATGSGTPVGNTYFAEARSASGPPAVNANGLVNAASFAATPVAPGQLVSIFGTNLATGGPYESQSVPLVTTLGPVQVRLNGVPIPLLYVSSLQINAQMPSSLGESGKFQLMVGSNLLFSMPIDVTLAPAAPAIFTSNGSGSGPGAILHADYSAVTASHPATAGEIVLVFCTGLGVTTPSVADGTAATSAAPAQATVTATVGGTTAPVIYAGLAPNYVGLYQVNLKVPAVSPAVPGPVVQITAGTVTSPPGVTIFVQ